MNRTTTHANPMPTRLLVGAVTLTMLALLAAPALAAPGPLPKPGDPAFTLAALTRYDDLYRGDKSTGVMEMTVATKHWKRTLKMRSGSLGKD